MKHAVLAIVVALAGLASSGSSSAEPLASVATSPQVALDYDALVQAEVRRLGHPGMAVGIVVGDRLVWSHGYGVRDKRRTDAVTPDTVFRIGSITKVFAGLALLQLRDDAKLTLDDALTLHVPEAQAVSPAAAPVTLRNLVTHTSGLPRDIPSGGTSEPDFLAKLRWLRPVSRAGTHTAYSNLAMGLVGPIVRRASGAPFRDHMRARVFAPLGMDATVWERRDVDPRRLATGHEKVKEGERKDKVDPYTASEWRMGAAEAFGGLYSSVTDLAKFVSFELSAWASSPERPEWASVLKRASLQESQTLAFSGAPEAQRYGVNWWLAEDPRFGARIHHTGATDDYSASVMMFPKRGLGVIVLSNFGPAPYDVEPMARRILERVAGSGVSANRSPFR